MSRTVSRPVFFIGMPRSGTTIAFEAFAQHPQLAWVSNYCRMWPSSPAANFLRRVFDNPVVRLKGHKKQYGKASKFNILFPQPDEAYEFWDHHTGVDFARDALPEAEASEATAKRVRKAVAAVSRWQGRERFAAKLTGPPRIRYLASIFPDALFVHVLRDARAVTHSLLRVPFWKAKGGYDGPFWQGLLSADDVARWETEGNDPGVLAALQWRRVCEQVEGQAAALGSDQLMTLTYEQFTAAPHDSLDEVARFCGLDASPEPGRWIDQGADLKNMNDKYRTDFSPDYIARLNALLGDA
ncbi:MAG: sulfotransferase [Pseudomonadota bacterium]